jgi:hypothetical protein
MDHAVGREIQKDDAVGKVAAGGFEHARVFGGVEGDEGRRWQGACPVSEYGVGAFGRAGVENESRGRGSEEIGEAFACGVESQAGASPIASGA